MLQFFALLAEGSSLLKARSNDTFRLKSRGAMGKLHRVRFPCKRFSSNTSRLLCHKHPVKSSQIMCRTEKALRLAFERPSARNSQRSVEQTQRSPRLRTRPHGSSDHGRDIEFWHHRSRSGAAPALSSTAAQHPPLRSIQTPEHLYQLESARGVRAPASPSKQQQIPLSRVGWRPRPSSGTDPALRRPTLARPRAAAPCDSVLGERLDLAGTLPAVYILAALLCPDLSAPPPPSASVLSSSACNCACDDFFSPLLARGRLLLRATCSGHDRPMLQAF